MVDQYGLESNPVPKEQRWAIKLRKDVGTGLDSRLRLVSIIFIYLSTIPTSLIIYTCINTRGKNLQLLKCISVKKRISLNTICDPIEGCRIPFHQIT